MNQENKEFYDLLESISKEQTFQLTIAPRQQDEQSVAVSEVSINCKLLSTAQLKTLIQTVVDSPITQSAFNSTATKILYNSITPTVPNLNVVDRLLFILKTRSESISSTATFKDGDKSVLVNFEDIYTKVLNFFNSNPTLLSPSNATDGRISINYGVTLLSAEEKLNDEIYKNLNPKIENMEELRKLIGEAFIHEIAKSITSIAIGDKTLEFQKIDFKSRIKAIESLPASLIQNVISYIEGYKKPIDEFLTIDGVTLAVDGSLFSTR